MTRYLIAAIVLACSSDVRAQGIVCQQIGQFTYCDRTGPQVFQPVPMLEPYRPAPTYVPAPGPQIIREYPQPYAPLPGYTPLR